jgi:hypothetical protein
LVPLGIDQIGKAAVRQQYDVLIHSACIDVQRTQRKMN